MVCDLGVGGGLRFLKCVHLIYPVFLVTSSFMGGWLLILFSHNTSWSFQQAFASFFFFFSDGMTRSSQAEKREGKDGNECCIPLAGLRRGLRDLSYPIVQKGVQVGERTQSKLMGLVRPHAES